jgi:hypothetical protein
MSDALPENKKTNWFKKHKIITVILVIILIAAVSSAASDSKKADSNKPAANANTSGTSAQTKSETPQEDLSTVSKEHTLSAGYYTAGIDIPAGVANVTAVSGTGNLSSSNIYNGGVNEMFGIDDGTDLYTSNFSNLKLPKNTTLSVNGDLVVKVTFTSVTANFSGRTYNESAAKSFSNGNYVAGTDFPQGTYKILATAGTGNLSSSNIFDGGVNEMFGVDDGSGFYNSQFLNARFNKEVTLTVSGGLTVKLIPAQ